MNNVAAERLQKVCESFVKHIGPQVDGVIALATYLNDDGTANILCAQGGNTFAVNGVMQHILDVRAGTAHSLGADYEPENNDDEDDGN